MTIVSLLRHGSTDWNERGLMQGRRDIPLSAAGRDEVARWRLPQDDVDQAEWVSSPLARAVETARILCGRAPRIEPALREMDWGAWEGRTLAALRAQHGREFTRLERRGLDFRPPGGESPREVVVRLARWLDSVAAAGRPLIAVTHNGVLRALYAYATGWDMTGKPPVRQRPASLHRFAVERTGALTLLECNVPLAREAAASGAEPPSA